MPNMMELMLNRNTDQRTMQALADQLRRRRDVSNLSMLSGDPTLQGFGGALHEDAQLQQKLKTAEAEKAADRELTQGYYNQLAENSAFNKTMAQRRQTEIERHNRAMEEAAKIRASGANAGKIPPTSAQTKTLSVVEKLQNIKELGGSFKDHYASTSGPMGGSLTNTLGKTPASSDAMKEQALFWSKYDLLYTLGARNDLFGSALTDQERAAWKEANLNPNSPPEVVREGFKILEGIALKALERQYMSDSIAYDPQWVQSVYSPVLGGSKQSAPSQEEEEELETTIPPEGQEIIWSEMK